MTTPIIFVTKAPHHYKMAVELLEKNNLKIQSFLGKDVEECKSIIEQQIERGARVVITFDYLLDQLMGLFPIPLVTIRRSAVIIVRIIMEAMKHTGEIALLSYDRVNGNITGFAAGMDSAFSLFDSGLKRYTINSYEKINQILDKIRADGIDTIIGPYNAQFAAKERGFTYYTAPFSETDLMEAVEQAYYHLRLYEQHVNSQYLVNTILNKSDQGAVALDAQGHILHINSAARNVFFQPEDDPIGQHYSNTLIKEVDIIDEVFKSRKAFKSVITLKNEIMLTCDAVPVIVDNALNFVILNCESANLIHEKDINVRNKMLSAKSRANKTFSSIVGSGEAISRAVAAAKRYAYYDSTILISAPSGCGKEVFAQSIHNASRRKDRAFIVINCAALPESILESLLFGYEPGTFTGAKSGGKAGLFELAHGGTVFLDEISELPLTMQSRFLRVIQEREVMRIGSDRPIPVDIRIIAATNRDLWEMVQNHTFREDLYYRLSVLLLEIPPLDDRKEDIEQLARYFLSERSAQLRMPRPMLTTDAVSFLRQRNYPGNVRQLNNILERAMILASSSIIDTDSLRRVMDGGKGIAEENGTADSKTEKEGLLSGYSKRNEEEAIRNALQRFSGSRQKAAASLGISTATLWRKMKKYAIE